MRDEEQGDEFSNGGNDRFKGLDEVFGPGGSPHFLGADAVEALSTLSQMFLEVSHSGPNDRMKAKDLARAMRVFRDAKDAIDIVDKEITRRWDFLRLVRMPAQCEEEDIENVRIAGVGRIDLRPDIYASILPGRKQDAFRWLQDNGRGDTVQETVNSSTLKAMLKKMVKDGEEYPEEIFKVTPFTMAALTRA